MVSVLQSIDSGHEDLIHGAELDYYGLNLATCSSDNCVKVNFIKSQLEKCVLIAAFRFSISRMVDSGLRLS